jgi:hypothetical protein
MHYQRWKRRGDADANVRLHLAGQPAEERFWARVDVADCWVWTGARTDGGYGSYRYSNDPNVSAALAHRWSWQHLVGAIPADLELDHVCRNRACVNPDHLEPVTGSVNVRRGAGVARARHRARSRQSESSTRPGVVSPAEPADWAGFVAELRVGRWDR